MVSGLDRYPSHVHPVDSRSASTNSSCVYQVQAVGHQPHSSSTSSLPRGVAARGHAPCFFASAARSIRRAFENKSRPRSRLARDRQRETATGNGSHGLGRLLFVSCPMPTPLPLGQPRSAWDQMRHLRFSSTREDTKKSGMHKRETRGGGWLNMPPRTPQHACAVVDFPSVLPSVRLPRLSRLACAPRDVINAC